MWCVAELRLLFSAVGLAVSQQSLAVSRREFTVVCIISFMLGKQKIGQKEPISDAIDRSVQPSLIQDAAE